MLGEYEGEVEEGAGRLEEFDLGEAVAEDIDEPMPPPYEEKQLIFLIEFLVDTLRLRPNALTRHNLDPCILQGQNCIILTFLHFPPMSICEKDMDTEKNVGLQETVFNSGKSLVFALTEGQFEEPPPVFLEVTAFKEMPHGFQIPKIEIGKTKVDLSELFRLLFEKFDEHPDDLPTAKSIKDNYLIEADGVTVADVDIYIRLTCLGQNIVTEFRRADGVCDPFLFKNLESEKIYECKQAMEKSDHVSVPRGTGKKCNAGKPPPPDPEDEKYEEIYAEINGNALTVSVEKSRRKVLPKPYKLEDFCDCQIPLPPELVEGASEKSSEPEQTGEQEIPDGGVGKCKNKIIFQVPPSDRLAEPEGWNAVSYNVNTCNAGEEHGHKGKNSFRIVTDDSVNRPTMPNDPEKDVFVLKIFKRGKDKKGKGNLELEFRTPKEKIVPPPKPPYMIEKAVGPEKQEKGKKKK